MMENAAPALEGLPTEPLPSRNLHLATQRQNPETLRKSQRHLFILEAKSVS